MDEMDMLGRAAGCTLIGGGAPRGYIVRRINVE